MNATWPFAVLKVSKDRLQLNATILGKLVFKADDIISIEPFGSIPIIGRGIKINHRVNKYNKKVIFWSFENPKTLIDKIKQTGFLSNEKPT
jgi:hypothetical protein